MKNDWVAEMFRALRDCGENISIVYGQAKDAPDRAAGGEPRWFELPHDQYDGISGLGELLRGQDLRVDRLPTLRGDRLTILRGLRGLLTILPALAVRRQHWKFDFGWTRDAGCLPAHERVAWKLFTREQTARILAAARSARVTVNTYLLFHLDAAVATELTGIQASRRWMVPVNLRGAVRRDEVLPPQMSFLGVDIEHDLPLHGLQARVDRLKARAYHWGMWIMLHLGRLLGVQGMRQDIRRRERQQHGVTGMFSNLGVWNVARAGHWVFCPAVTRVYPVGAGCITMNGRLGLAMQLHDALGKDLRGAQALLEAWSGACVQQRAAAAIEPAVVAPRQVVNI